MAEWHLRELRNELEKRGWTVVAEHPSHHLYISGSWEIQHDPSMPPLFIDFSGIDDLHTLSMNESYACNFRGNNQDGLYFSKRGEGADSTRRVTWKRNLVDFVSQLETLSEPSHE